MIKELHEVEQSLAEAVEESSKSYLKDVVATLSAYRLVDLNASTVRLAIEQITAFNNVVVG